MRRDAVAAIYLLASCAAVSGCAHDPADDWPERPAPEPASVQELRVGYEIGPDAVLIPIPASRRGPPLALEEAEVERQTPEVDGTADEIPTEISNEVSDEPPEPSRGPTKRALTISLGKQAFAYTEDGAVVRSGPISSGAKGYPTPTGKFRVLGKEEDKVSSRYTNQLGMQAWMPYAIQFHGHYFLHEGWLPGYPDSHGCVRVGAQDARFLFETLKIGDPITVKN